MGGFANNAPIVTDGLVLYVDAGNGNSYPGSGTTWSDLAGSNVGTLTNGPTYDSGNAGSIVFDGSNNNIDLDTHASTFSGLNIGSVSKCLFLIIITYLKENIVGFNYLGKLMNIWKIVWMN